MRPTSFATSEADKGYVSCITYKRLKTMNCHQTFIEEVAVTPRNKHKPTTIPRIKPPRPWQIQGGKFKGDRHCARRSLGEGDDVRHH